MWVLKFWQNDVFYGYKLNATVNMSCSNGPKSKYGLRKERQSKGVKDTLKHWKSAFVCWLENGKSVKSQRMGFNFTIKLHNQILYNQKLIYLKKYIIYLCI